MQIVTLKCNNLVVAIYYIDNSPIIDFLFLHNTLIYHNKGYYNILVQHNIYGGGGGYYLDVMNVRLVENKEGVGMLHWTMII